MNHMLSITLLSCAVIEKTAMATHQRLCMALSNKMSFTETGGPVGLSLLTPLYSSSLPSKPLLLCFQSNFLESNCTSHGFQVLISVSGFKTLQADVRTPFPTSFLAKVTSYLRNHRVLFSLALAIFDFFVDCENTSVCVPFLCDVSSQHLFYKEWL